MHALTLNRRLVQDIRATYLAGYPLVLVNPTLLHVRQLHTLIEEGVTYRLASAAPLESYTLRRVNGVPTTVLLFTPPSASQTIRGR